MYTNDLIMNTLLSISRAVNNLQLEVTSLREDKTEKVEPLYMSINEACERYAVKRNTMYDITKLDNAPATLKIGSRRVLPIRDYDNYMRTQFNYKENE